ncbi:hypothetical protein Phou_080670 [Phytohabitans houttuyneae]|uniref:Uncharacterized protein n=1 Tax=Phytohabitans houttuyneae TaxID=1076126 RepID=A0A6V8KQ66_9ACTN|nr:hypothetical protein Phou_080670 [Phytohabitans houttuyneae]
MRHPVPPEAVSTKRSYDGNRLSVGYDIGLLVKSLLMETVRLVGGNLAVDFVNTRTGPPAGPRTATC